MSCFSCFSGLLRSFPRSRSRECSGLSAIPKSPQTSTQISDNAGQVPETLDVFVQDTSSFQSLGVPPTPDTEVDVFPDVFTNVGAPVCVHCGEQIHGVLCKVNDLPVHRGCWKAAEHSRKLEAFGNELHGELVSLRGYKRRAAFWLDAGQILPRIWSGSHRSPSGFWPDFEKIRTGWFWLRFEKVFSWFRVRFGLYHDLVHNSISSQTKYFISRRTFEASP